MPFSAQPIQSSGRSVIRFSATCSACSTSRSVRERVGQPRARPSTSVPARTGDTDYPASSPRPELRGHQRSAQRRGHPHARGRVTLAEVACRPTPAYTLHTGHHRGVRQEVTGTTTGFRCQSVPVMVICLLKGGGGSPSPEIWVSCGKSSQLT